MMGWKCGVISPWERNSGNQSVRARSSNVSAGIGSPCSSARRTAKRAGGGGRAEGGGAWGARDGPAELLEAGLPTGPGQAQALDGDVPVDGLGRHVLDLVE